MLKSQLAQSWAATDGTEPTCRTFQSKAVAAVVGAVVASVTAAQTRHMWNTLTTAMRPFDNLYCIFRRYHDNQSRMLWATSHYERYILEKLNNLRHKYRDATDFDHILVAYFGDSATELNDNFEVKKN